MSFFDNSDDFIFDEMEPAGDDDIEYGPEVLSSPTQMGESIDDRIGGVENSFYGQPLDDTDPLSREFGVDTDTVEYENAGTVLPSLPGGQSFGLPQIQGQQPFGLPQIEERQSFGLPQIKPRNESPSFPMLQTNSGLAQDYFRGLEQGRTPLVPQIDFQVSPSFQSQSSPSFQPTPLPTISNAIVPVSPVRNNLSGTNMRFIGNPEMPFRSVPRRNNRSEAEESFRILSGTTPEGSNLLTPESRLNDIVSDQVNRIGIEKDVLPNISERQTQFRQRPGGSSLSQSKPIETVEDLFEQLPKRNTSNVSTNERNDIQSEFDNFNRQMVVRRQPFERNMRQTGNPFQEQTFRPETTNSGFARQGVPKARQRIIYNAYNQPHKPKNQSVCEVYSTKHIRTLTDLYRIPTAGMGRREMCRAIIAYQKRRKQRPDPILLKDFMTKQSECRLVKKPELIEYSLERNKDIYKMMNLGRKRVSMRMKPKTKRELCKAFF